TVRAAVLDGAVDPTAGSFESGLQQVEGFEQSLDSFLAACSADAKCPFGNEGNSEGAYDDLMKAIDASPVPSAAGRPPITLGMANTAVADALYSDEKWPQLAQALSDADNGDGAGLLALYDEYYVLQPDGTYANSLEAFQVISCMDSVERPTVAEDDADALKLHE